MEQEVLKKRWDTLEGRKESLHERNEKYSTWTLPYVYPRDEQKHHELDSDLDSVGARAVNHLANKIINTLFPAYRPFVRLELSEEAKDEFEASKVPMVEIDRELIKGEKQVVRALDKMAHRTAATMACKYLIITGNALMYYPMGDKTKCQVYNTRNYCVVRDLSGEVIEIMTKDQKAFETFSEEVQNKLRVSSAKDKKYDNGTNVNLYTRIKLEKEGKFKVTQAADMVDLELNDNSYAKKDLPWVPLTWNLARGEDYGRGMVEDYKGAFNALAVLSQALIEGIISAAAVKFLVNPASVVDVEQLNKSRNGTYHSGREGDIIAIKSDKHLDFQQVREVVADYTRQIAQAFLLNSAVTRDAERVTAEEIREQAQELEMAYGGIYSRFTEEWQEPIANLILSRMDITVSETTIYPTIITGMDTLSRLGDLDNFRMFLNDMSLLNNVPEDIRAWMKPHKIMAWVGNNRGVDYAAITKTEDERAAEQQAAMEQEAAMMEQEAANTLMTEGTKQMMKEQ